jgi:hypothetical protein
MKVPLKIRRLMGTLHGNLFTSTITRCILLTIRNDSDKIFEKFKIPCQAFFPKTCLLWDNVKKYGRARDVTDIT